MLRGLAVLACAAVLAPSALAARAQQQSFLVVRPAGGKLVLHDRPGGAVVARLGATTTFGSPRVLGVVAARDGWLGVTTDALPNGHVGWLERGRATVAVVHTALRVSLSARRLELLERGRVVRSFAIAVGAPGSPTPLGRFAVAEKLVGSSVPAVYGCCILGLSAHQPNPPASWRQDEDYLVAIHGGGGIGSAVSAGCLHLDAPSLRYLIDRVPLGTPVFIGR